MKKLLLALALAGSTLLSAQASAQTLKIGTEGAYPPFNFQDSAGNLDGFDVQIGLALCEKMKVECDVVAQDWDGIIPGLVAKKYDMIIASMFITEERKKSVSFTDPYYLAAMTHAAPKGAGLTDFTNEGMKGKTIGAQSGTTQADYVAAVYPDADIKLYPTQDEVNLDMANGRLDLQVGDMIPLLDWVTKNDDGKACCELVGTPITDPKFVGEGVGIAVRQDDNDLREKLNVALKEIREDGTYKKINDKYFSIDIYTMK
ncbi:MAG TPA: ABC transporter substrate-binding protein [Shinella sp.]|jgi:polar amino acid transport system substrate-binding protein|uniref:ABC transporter substrate-binding protein n=1 Tax=Shinella sp. TaxID=1870904 RepID=UPI0029B685DF|nr:ABC transporter substrate-binding protein [Shinella sp.]MDX3973373.1 ABC transporter substrate-binding protein [Shinella sp.]HEV7250978.1 ABC transporter substrate-binding protein [Shinella sp.]